MEEEIEECALWCVYTHRILVLMSTHLIKESRPLLLEEGVGVGAAVFLESLAARLSWLFFLRWLLCVLLMAALSSLLLAWLYLLVVFSLLASVTRH